MAYKNDPKYRYSTYEKEGKKTNSELQLLQILKYIHILIMSN